ncbi:hypothetical protein BIW11_08217 [Tropilaelaps mercedesae]|uniref:Uncharacterized protein n=1 Tax=Tropilaelaps mercedesae TaxID=418985 RepID=A0A1V9XQI8_9ACAR|nr:hypothetical protein BIW11_08217 [Tropilaelaps mercedesae]
MKAFVLAFGLLVGTAYSENIYGQRAHGSSYRQLDGYAGTVSAAPVSLGGTSSYGGASIAAPVAVAVPTRPPKVHEIHTSSEREVIRVEEYKRPRQVIRIHDAPAPPPEVIRIQAPPEPQKVIRVIQSARPTRVQFTQAGPEVQVVNIPIRQVQQVFRPVVETVAAAPAPIIQRSVAVATPAPVVQTVAAVPARVVHRSVAVAAPAPVVQTFTAPAPVIHPSVELAAPIARSFTSHIQAFSSTPALSYVSAPSQISYATAPAQVSYSGSDVAYGSSYKTYNSAFYKK